jgi:hypothetical protein
VSGQSTYQIASCLDPTNWSIAGYSL